MASNWQERRLVVTGLGVVTPLGTELDVFWKRLIAGESGIDRITAFDAAGYDTQMAGEVLLLRPAAPPEEREEHPVGVGGRAGRAFLAHDEEPEEAVRGLVVGGALSGERGVDRGFAPQSRLEFAAGTIEVSLP